MRRTVPVLAATAGAAALLANFHTTPEGKLPTAAGGPASTAPTASTAPPAAPGPPSTSATPSTTSTSVATRSVDGPDVYTDYGDVQVRAVLRGTHLVDVEALVLPSDRARSQRISEIAGPELRIEALRAQSADIDIVSGATYTSEGYRQSLQGALDRA